MTRRIRYQVACSLDGYIAGPQGEADWIIMDPEIDFAALFDQFDTLLMGRRTYEAAMAMGGGFFGKEIVVCSRTMRPGDHPGLHIVSADLGPSCQRIRQAPGKDIWLFGGGQLFRSLLELGLVDTVEPAIIPVLLGDGIPFLPSPAEQTGLALTGHRVYGESGIVLLQYAVQPKSPQRRRPGAGR